MKRKSFLSPASSKDTNLRSLDQPLEATKENNSLSVPTTPDTETEPKKKGRIRSISVTLKPLKKQPLSPLKTNFDALKEESDLKISSKSDPTITQTKTITLSPVILSESLLNDPALSAFMSETGEPTSIETPTIEIPPTIEVQDTDSEHSIGSVEEVTREKVM